MTIGERIKEARLKAGLSQTTLAEKAGTGQVYLSLLESGKRPDPSISTLIKIASGLGIRVEKLVKGM